MIHACIYVDVLRFSADAMSLHYAICLFDLLKHNPSAVVYGRSSI